MSGFPVVPYWLGMLIETGVFLSHILDLRSCESRLVDTDKTVGHATVSYDYIPCSYSEDCSYFVGSGVEG